MMCCILLYCYHGFRQENDIFVTPIVSPVSFSAVAAPPIKFFDSLGDQVFLLST